MRRGPKGSLTAEKNTGKRKNCKLNTVQRYRDGENGGVHV